MPAASMPLESQVASQPAAPVPSTVAPIASATHEVPSSHDHPPMPKVQTGVVGVGVGVGGVAVQAMPAASIPLELQVASQAAPFSSIVAPIAFVRHSVPSSHIHPSVPNMQVGVGLQAMPAASMPLESQVASQPAAPVPSTVAPIASATHEVPSSHDHPPMPKVQ